MVDALITDSGRSRARPPSDPAATCGFTDLGMLGCAPTLEELAVDADTLLHVSVTDDGLEVLSEKN